MTREQALENALRCLWVATADLSPENHITIECERAHAERAVALPPDGVNAEMLAALQLTVAKFDDKSLNKATIGLLRALISRASHIPMPSKTFNPPAQA